MSLIYEAGDLRYIKWGEQEILRRVYVAIRDRNWGTIPPVFSNHHLKSGADWFEIDYEVANKQGEIDFAWKGSIRGDSQGTIVFTLEGAARSTFWRNRIGFCVLHPAACAGATCTIEHMDGSIETSRLPISISPDQPVRHFGELRAMAHEAAPGRWAEVRYQGDIFEMEDQRNWTDASYKTYSTPLRLPYPVEISKGTRVVQSVILSLAAQAPFPTGEQTRARLPEIRSRRTDSKREAVAFTIDLSSPGFPLPPIGLGTASHGQVLSDWEIQRLAALHLHHLRVDLALSDPGWPARLSQAAQDSRSLGAPLNVAIQLAPGAAGELEQLREALDRIQPEVSAWLIFPEIELFTGGSPTSAVVNLARRFLAGFSPGARFASGTNTDFIFLQRNLPPLEDLDMLTFAIHPQAHAFDNASLVETLEAQAAAVSSARALAGRLPVMASPVTLRPRWNPYATGPAPETPPGALPPQVDVRQMSLLGAGWTAGSIRSLAEGGAAQVTFYETTGWRGVMETENGSPLPELFHSIPGGVFPIYHVLADATEFAGGQVLPTSSEDPLRVNGLALRKEGQVRLLIANYGGQPQRVNVAGLKGIARLILRSLDEESAEFAMRQPEEYRTRPGEAVAAASGELWLELLPYAVVRVDQG